MPLSEERGERKRAKVRMVMELKCLTCRSNGFFEAVICNLSEDGLYLECDHEMKPGENIRIHLLQLAPGEFKGGETNESAGIVRWCKALAEARQHRYGAGIRLF